MGIGKRSLMEDYYFDEIGEIVAEWNDLHTPQGGEEEIDAMSFLGGGGERVG